MSKTPSALAVRIWAPAYFLESHGSQANGGTVHAVCEKKTPQLLGDFWETVLEGKLIPRAPLQDSEPPRAGDSISDVFLVNLSRFKAQEKRVETRGESRGRNPNFPRWGGGSLIYKGISLVNPTRGNWVTLGNPNH